MSGCCSSALRGGDQRLFLQGEIDGTTHLCTGQEAVAVGVARGAARRRHRRRDLPRPRRMRSRRGVDPAALARRAARPRDRHLRRAGRLDERDRPRARADRLLRDRRRLDRGGHRRRARARAAATASRWRSSATGPANQAYFPECLNFAAVFEPAGRLRLREQPLRRVDADGSSVTAGGDIAGARRAPTASRREVDGNDVARGAATRPPTAVARARERRGPDPARVPDLPLHGPLARRTRAALPAGRRARSVAASAIRCRAAALMPARSRERIERRDGRPRRARVAEASSGARGARRRTRARRRSRPGDRDA